jgi:hypothetical protein
MLSTKNTHKVSTRLLFSCGIWLIGLGIYFIVFRPPLLPEDARFMSASINQIHTNLPGIENWLQRVFTVMGGFMSGAGVLTIFLANKVMPLRLSGTSWVIALSGVSTVMLMSGINFALNSDFKILLLAPALIWLASLILYISGR